MYFGYAPLFAQNSKEVTAKMILGNPKYQGICYGGYRKNTRDIEPTVSEVKEDLKILAALNIKIIRTYNLHREEIVNVLKDTTSKFIQINKDMLTLNKAKKSLLIYALAFKKSSC